MNPSVLCFRRFPVAAKFIDKREGVIKIFRRNFFWLTVSIISVWGGILWCFFNFGFPKILDKMWGYQDFPSKIFCLTVPKKIVGEPFCAVFQKKFIDKRGGSIKIFRRKIFVSQCRTFPYGVESFSVSLLLGIEKV